ncbi:Histidine kinase-, DNA gyrase B-, and HSP90-like ATPase [Frankia sp. EI5c]|uniref:ATP-binding protein n=1 Tax=Frankia sp. EI5c TaxID=683316 RepID=UPI0007C257A0|nr:ATP-binding protein [Frankia sp. EI5c]OAA23313.1 Histidine kinase-, DNA gyrase B-, and HSP90-like ATPase [Frankia sp. EI5c]
MASSPLFQSPDTATPPAPTRAQVGGDATHADLIQVDTALESMRDSGYDLTAAVGEPVDNSLEANARIIRVEPTYGANNQSVDAIAVADDGAGIDPDNMAHVLSMGYSTRYGQRSGLGRFGVGMKLAGLSLGRRIDVYSTRRIDDRIWHAYIDLDEIKNGTQKHIIAESVEDWPSTYARLMADAQGNPFSSGTLVIYGNIDRLTSGGHYATALDEKISELRTFIARTYRYYLDKGRTIELAGTPVTLLDPLFLLDNPRIIKQYKPLDVRGTIIEQADIEIRPGQRIHVTVSLAPEEFRPKSGSGGTHDYKGRPIRDYHIAESAGKISMVRNGREINYDIVAKLLPAGVDKIDRYIGIEVQFPAELDEFFQVRNVKRGAVPVMKLREELRKWLDRPVRHARSQIRRHWSDVETRERAEAQAHESVTAAVARVEQTSPPGQAGKDVSPEQEQQYIRDVLDDLQLDSGGDDVDTAARVQQEIEEKPITMVDAAWSGSELFEIVHLNGKAIVKINHRHPFWKKVYGPIKAAASGTTNSTDEELLGLLRNAEAGIDALILAYAKAENLHTDAAQFDDLRTYWGTFARSYINEVIKED